ncbi:uncharacterized protein LOC118467088 [Anopheles albimanus]|uniref:uncharacterized protein LOC118467088 n=1 Tax=Anopheles albimanus TaxID=7167 RepID=UPI001640E57F|nr:uncharacterized protein LOC118467088 [Anopheles albimanus]XP_035793026.1 uncharacterized protein LOC118467088 [Anopheles albimanus]
MEFSVHDAASDEEPQAEEFDDFDSHQNGTLAHRMIMFVYGRLAIDRDARTLAFWEEFRLLHGDVGMSAQELRDFFYHDLMESAACLENLSYHVRQYINPMFNRYRGEVLRQQDTLGLCYSSQTRRYYVSATSSKMPIELLLEEPSQPRSTPPAPVTPNSSMESYRLPTTEQVLRFVSDNISEPLWTEEEKPTKAALSTAEWLKRMAVLTQNGISLGQCAEPEMKCYNRMRLLGLLAAQDEDMPGKGSHGISSSSYLEVLRTPIDYSTPFEPRSKMTLRQKPVLRTGTAPLADSGYDLSSIRSGPPINSTPRLPTGPAAKESNQRSAREERLRAMQNDGQRPCCSYRKPT